MQEREVSVGQQTMKLERPFLVMATQNPLEQEGTYPLPEAQLDRFMFNTYVDYPSDEDLAEIVMQTTGETRPTSQPVMDAAEIEQIQAIVRRIPIARPVVDYVVRLSARDAARTIRRRPQLHQGLRELGLWRRARPSIWRWAPRPMPCCTASRTPRSRASARSPAACCVTASP